MLTFIAKYHNVNIICKIFNQMCYRPKINEINSEPSNKRIFDGSEESKMREFFPLGYVQSDALYTLNTQKAHIHVILVRMKRK